MKRRWEFNPEPYVAAWLFGGLVVFIVGTALFGGCDRAGCGMNADRLSTLPLVLLCLWVGPFALAFAGAILVFGGMALWAGRPRRVTEPVTEDLRTVDR